MPSKIVAELSRAYGWFKKNIDSGATRDAVVGKVTVGDLPVSIEELAMFMHHLKMGVALVEAGGQRGRSRDERKNEAIELAYTSMGSSGKMIPEIPPWLANLLVELLLCGAGGLAKFDVKKAAELVNDGVDVEQAIEQAS